jgi:hypothetical protein
VLFFSAQAVFSELAGIAVCCDGTSCCVVDDLGIRHIDLTTANVTTLVRLSRRQSSTPLHIRHPSTSRLFFARRHFLGKHL